MRKIVALAYLCLLTFISTSINAATYAIRTCKHSDTLTCYVVKRGDSWQTLFPDVATQDYMKKLNRLGNALERGMTIAVPKDKTALDVMEIAPFPRQISPPGSKVIYVTLTDLAWGAYDAQGTLLRWGPVSGAKGYCPDIHSRCTTPTGKFAIYRTEGKECKSSKFPVGRGGAPMPYCMFFKGGFAMHGSYDIPGYNASHGCVRMIKDDAQWLNQDFVGDENVPIIITKSS